MRRVPPESIRRVVIIRPRFLGDVCLTLPLLDAVRTACPSAQVGFVIEEGLAPLLREDPRLARVFAVAPRPSIAQSLSLVRELRGFAPDLVLDCFCNPRTTLWSALARAPVRVGYAGKGWRSAVVTHHSRPRTLSAVGFHLASLAALGWPVADEQVSPRLHVPEHWREDARAGLAAAGIPAGARPVGFHPGARWPTRRWAPERFHALAERMLAAHPDTVALFTAGPGEEAWAEAACSGLPPERARVIRGWPLTRFVGLQSLCPAFVCGDTGPMHTAVAAGTPTLGLMSRNRPAMFFPYPESDGHRAHWARVECSPCHRDECADLRCLHRLDVEGGWRHLAAMLARRGDAAPIR